MALDAHWEDDHEKLGRVASEMEEIKKQFSKEELQSVPLLFKALDVEDWIIGVFIFAIGFIIGFVLGI